MTTGQRCEICLKIGRIDEGTSTWARWELSFSGGFALKNFPDSQSYEASNWAPAGLTWSSYGQDAWLTARYLRAGWCDQQVDNSCYSYQTLCGGDLKTFKMTFFNECDFRSYMYAEAFGENVEYTSGYYFANACQ